MLKYLNKALILLNFYALSTASLGQAYKTDQIEVELVSESKTVVPGETLWLAIRLDPIEHWHTYWKFGGDSGVATFTSNWDVPEGTEVGEIVWPIPEWTPFLGSELVTFTYEREVFLPLPINVPADFTGSTFNLSTTVDWQVCEEICIPGEANFALTLDVSDSVDLDPRWEKGFAEARSLTPIAESQHQLTARFNAHDNKINVMISSFNGEFENVDEAYFFPTERRIMKYAPYRKVMLDGGRIQISTEQHRRFSQDLTEFEGTLKVIDDNGAWRAFDIRPERSDIAWDHSIEVELISETSNIVPGETIWLGLRLNPADHWHTYWKMGGDSGEPTRCLLYTSPSPRD